MAIKDPSSFYVDKTRNKHTHLRLHSCTIMGHPNPLMSNLLNSTNTNMDPVTTSFIVFFALFFGGFILLFCLGCFIHCCCSGDAYRYRPDATNEAIILDRLTRKERIAVIDRIFSDYDALVR